ncbi:S26 family signal peptidase [Micromonospora sp. NBC_00898]|uniref:S26 family signal peptidase n=1 Tax=Micromonospora sp. NBC_00898 TaxID=2975981 RepID=UPI00386C0375|nr:S26 family signal peptidase [Micromonospora sp. NBC_00898]
MQPLIYSLVAAAVVGAVPLLLRRALVVRVVGHSMTPNLCDGDRLLGWRRRCRVGDVVVFRRDAGDDLAHLVKRVAAVAGDSVPAEFRHTFDGDRVPLGYILVRGDNARSLDSRRLGLVSLDSVVAVVVLRLEATCT